MDRQGYAERYKLEPPFAVLGNYRRPPIRWEHHFSVCRGLFPFPLVLICIYRLVQQAP